MSEEPKQSYYSKISLANKTPEEAERIKKLFEDNKNLAYKVATKYYKTKHWDYDEALQIAQMGLWKACLIWDPGKYRLSTLAYNIIHRDFMDFDRQQKRQPDILFNLEDNCVTDDLSLDELLHSYTDRCTSLCDKTNKVVYENDILVNEYGDNCLVKFQIDHLNFGRICLLNINNINSDINKNTILIPCCIEDSKVIGNSWENKELLKEN